MKALHIKFTWHDSPSNSLRKARNKSCIANANTAVFFVLFAAKRNTSERKLTSLCVPADAGREGTSVVFSTTGLFALKSFNL